ncbi:hypothetical protein [Paenibacillus hexagrammi]|uniref:Uncharacterized protein n=1 Tax=Paenibacillus hexagrammi TaxID=2908839 RepID=A0ABY3SJR3_9BACL|nr:hypothetical protein [Paenibacillus sp. YPD9-1]UJF33733.1 hypothetical protein L0M14_00235 [Paenibacillus sp. YPD9-1]
MFKLNEVYNIVWAEYIGLDWKDQENLEWALETYNGLSQTDQSKFDSLVTKALSDCRVEFKSFPKTHRTKADMELREELEHAIMEKLQTLFHQYID